MGQTPSTKLSILSEEERHLISKSYMSLRGKSASFSAMLFANIFVAAPAFRRHFDFSVGSKKYENHLEKFTAEISELINSLHKDSRLKFTLDRNADKHVNFDVTFEEYVLLKNCFLNTLKMTLQQAFTSDIEVAWNKGLTTAFTYIWERILQLRAQRHQ